MIEEWKLINGYENYEISNFGNVRSWLNNASKRVSTPKILKPSVAKNGYLCVTLYPNSQFRAKRFTIHRLVANTFISNDNNSFNIINHKDENKANNHVNNLEWCTQKYNLKYSSVHANGLQTKNKIKSSNAEKPIKATKNGISYSFKSVAEAIRQLGIPSRGGIQRCLYNKAKFANGFEWEFI